MNILFFSHYFPPEGNAPANRVYEMTRRWVNAGHHVTVITGCPNVPAGIPYAGYRNRWRFTETMDGIRVLRVWTYLAPNKGRVRRIANYLSFMISAAWAGLFQPRPHLIIATSPQFFCGWAGAIVSRLRRLPFVLEVRDLWPESIATVGALEGRRTISFLEHLEHRLYAAARHIVTVGEGYRERLLQRGVAADRVSVITNGIVPAAAPPRTTAAAVRDRFALGDRFVCAYIGTIGMACGLDVVLRAAAGLTRQKDDTIRFLLVGDGAVRVDLEREAARQGLLNVVFAGLQPHADMPAFLAAADTCLVHLRRKELFSSVLPSKMLEAMALARPVILGVEGHAARLLAEAGGGLCIQPDNEQELVDAIQRLRNDPAAAGGMGQSGRDYVLRHFNLDALATDYLSVLQGVLAGVMENAK